jgi:DNA repair protein RecO
VKQLQTQGIVLSRTDYGEANRIVTLLTPEQGKLRLMARGVRKPKSKLAGGIELFSISDITYLQGRGEIGTLVSSRLLTHYGTIVKDITRVQLGYDLIKMLNRATEDQPEPEYFELLQQALQALDNLGIATDLIRLWFEARLLHQAGYSPNLHTDTNNDKLQAGETYNFDFDAMAFVPHDDGHFNAAHIKTLRLLFSHHPLQTLHQVQGFESLLPDLTPLLRIMLQTYIRT